MAVIYSGSTYSIATSENVAGANNYFLANEIADEYDSHIDLTTFATVDNTLEGVPGTEKRINVYGANGSAEFVDEGAGNGSAISTTLSENIYRIKTAQAWFRYTDEAAQRDPIAIQTGIAHLGTSLFNHVNGSLFDAYASATLVNADTDLDFDCFVDAQAKLTLNDAAGENAEDAQRRLLPQTFAFLSKNMVAKARKAMKDQIVYVPELAWTPGYVGSVAGTSLIYKQDAVDNVVYLATKEAVTIFNKSGIEFETAARSGGTSGTANLRYNDVYARKYYITALTDATKCVKIFLGGADSQATERFSGDGSTKAFTLAETAVAIISVKVSGIERKDYTTAVASGVTTLTFTNAPASGTNNIEITYTYAD